MLNKLPLSEMFNLCLFINTLRSSHLDPRCFLGGVLSACNILMSKAQRAGRRLRNPGALMEVLRF